jgi:hypothetical protein
VGPVPQNHRERIEDGHRHQGGDEPEERGHCEARRLPGSGVRHVSTFAERT